ncbi:MAG: hypothetical protein B9S32_00555 [Verrucomicrobia bacterium Tous-C9LFEB]|nr:MAG: hypothetical protein B9S32_00555 [Verrucomicrobia bacterium Tous-C9LFEB]
MPTPGRLLYLLCRDLKRGLRASWHDYRTAPQIRRYRCPDFAGQRSEIPLHLLTGQNDWLLALWMLASFHHFTQRRWNVIVHDDGTLPPEAATALREAFPELRVIPRAEADVRMQRLLAPFPRCWNYRQSHPLGLKIFDMAALTRSERFIILDSDVLFFARPDAILDWVETNRNESRFIEDVAEASNVTAEQAQTQLGVTLWSRVNSGLCLLPSAAVPASFCEKALEQTAILEGHIWRVEQTLFALCASRYGAGGLLPRTYEVTLARHSAPNATARHYVGAVRNEFYAEGLPRLKSLLLPEAVA